MCALVLAYNESWCGSLFSLDHSPARSTIILCNFRNIIYFIVNIRKLYNIITFFLSIAFTTLFRRTWRHYLFTDYCRWPFAVTFIELIRWSLITTDYRDPLPLLVNHESASMELVKPWNTICKLSVFWGSGGIWYW